MQRPCGKHNLGLLRDGKKPLWLNSVRGRVVEMKGEREAGTRSHSFAGHVGLTPNAVGSHVLLKQRSVMSDGCFTKMNQSLCLLEGQTRVEAGRTLERLCSDSSQDVTVAYTTAKRKKVKQIMFPWKSQQDFL